MDVIDLGEGYFITRFALEEDIQNILKGGPWFITGHYLIIKRWSPNFITKYASLKSVAVWFRLPGLPVEYYDPLVLKEIRSMIGPVLWIDANTASEIRGRYARFCVQVDLDKPPHKS